MKRHTKSGSSFLTRLLPADGQDLAEYALIIALLAFGMTAGLQSVAQSLNTTFSNIGAYISSSTA